MVRKVKRKSMKIRMTLKVLKKASDIPKNRTVIKFKNLTNFVRSETRIELDQLTNTQR